MNLLALVFLISVEPPLASPPVKLPLPPPIVKQEPAATLPIVINADELYVVEQASDSVPAILISEPPGFVSVTEESGPLRIRGKFAGGAGVETKTFKAAKIWIVEPKQMGDCALLTWPVGAKTAAEVWRFPVRSLVGPRPPPQPAPTPQPTPAPTPQPVSGLRVLLIEETNAALTEDQNRALNSLKVREWLNRKTTKNSDGSAGWRRWDKDVQLTDQTPAVLRELWTATKPKIGQLPQICIALGADAQLHPVTSEEQLLGLLKQAGGE